MTWNEKLFHLALDWILGHFLLFYTVYFSLWGVIFLLEPILRLQIRFTLNRPSKLTNILAWVEILTPAPRLFQTEVLVEELDLFFKGQ